jgi:hypothetical protein
MENWQPQIMTTYVVVFEAKTQPKARFKQNDCQSTNKTFLHISFILSSVWEKDYFQLL